MISKPTSPTRMAEAATAVRAAHTLHEKSIIFDDPFAIHLTSSGWRTILENFCQANWQCHYYDQPQTNDLHPLSAAYITHLRIR